MNTRLALLTTIVSAIAIAMAIGHLASWLEAFSFVTGALCVWLTVKENAWNFPATAMSIPGRSLIFLPFRRSQPFAARKTKEGGRVPPTAVLSSPTRVED